MVLLLMVLMSFAGCTTDDLYDTTNDNYFALADTEIYLTSLPSNISLELGKSVYIQNGEVAFVFQDIVEDNESNSAVSLKVIYKDGSNTVIVLNTNHTPKSYSLENGFDHSIDLRELNYVNGTYQIVFGYSHHAYWLC